MMREIKLTRGKVALVDEADFGWLSQWSWNSRPNHGIWYARRGARDGDKKNTVLMHRQIMGAWSGQRVDHRDGNGLNNQRKNLRFCTSTQNHANRRKLSGCSSKYKGVCWHKQRGKWVAYIKIYGKSSHLGLFANEEDAARAYNNAAIERFGEFAKLNIIENSAPSAFTQQGGGNALHSS
ncbi:HNH endonuclease [Patescibacteria group bacterium]|nr:HNH endonuclease [Patescibacteria group bacterium]